MPKHLWDLEVLCKTAIPETIPQHVTKYKISDWWKVFTFSSETVSREKSATNFSIDCSRFSRKRRASTDKRYRLTTVLSLNTHNQLQCSTLIDTTHLKTHQSNGKLVFTMVHTIQLPYLSRSNYIDQAMYRHSIYEKLQNFKETIVYDTYTQDWLN